MAVALHVYIVDPGDEEIKVEHIFYGMTDKQAQTYRDEHLGSCSYFSAAEKAGNVIEEIEEISEDEIPQPEDFEEDEEKEEGEQEEEEGEEDEEPA
jgi:hypothetical protein